MNKTISSIFLFFSLIIYYIECHNVQCSRNTEGKRLSKYHCSGLNIIDDGDSHCCFWKYNDITTNNSIVRCSSVNQNQFDDLDGYIESRLYKYGNLEIECTEDQKIYCSNPLFDEEHISNCNELAIYDTKDKYCCRWRFTNKTYDSKSYDYCASINEYQYITIKDYVKYKEKQGAGNYDDLSIDCFGVYINILRKILYLLLLIYL